MKARRQRSNILPSIHHLQFTLITNVRQEKRSGISYITRSRKRTKDSKVKPATHSSKRQRFYQQRIQKKDYTSFLEIVAQIEELF